MKDNLTRQQAAYVKLHGVPMPEAVQAHALSQMFALQSLFFEDHVDESEARREFYDPAWWHALVPGASTDSDELRVALLHASAERVVPVVGVHVELLTSTADEAAAASGSSSTDSSSASFLVDSEVISHRLREEGYCIISSPSSAVAGLCRELARIQAALQAAALPPQFIFVFNAPWQLLAEHWVGPATAALGEDSIMEADMNCWALRREPEDGCDAPYVGANFGASHRDQTYAACHTAEGAPTSVNLWTPFNESGAAIDNGAMRVLPCHADDFFFAPAHPLHLQTSASLAVAGAAEAVATLTCTAGAACLWSPSLIHWGSSCKADAAAEPRQSLAVTFRAATAVRSQFGVCASSGDSTSAGPMILADLSTLSLQRRLAYVAKGLLAYSHWHAGFPGVALARV
jgi:hypothetical protein